MQDIPEIFIKFKNNTKSWIKKTFHVSGATLLCTENRIDKLYMGFPNAEFSEPL